MPAPTGEFYELSVPEADALNADGGHEALTFDDYKPNRARGQEGATFRLYWDQKRVFKNPPGHRTQEEEEAAARGQSLYAVYDAKSLWDWVKTHEKDPTNSFQISYEDWMQLYAEYGNFGPIPEFVSRLPSLEWPDFGPGTVWAHKESGPGWKATVDGALRFSTFTNFTEDSQKPDYLPTDGLYFSGPLGEERIVKGRYGKSTDHLTGPPGREQVYKTALPNGSTRFYAMDEEPRELRHRTQTESDSERAFGRLVKITSADGLAVWHYAGPKKHERLVYSERHRTSVTGRYRWVEHVHFTGRRGRERFYKFVRFQRGQYGVNDIDTHYLRGPHHKEYVYKRVSGNKHDNWVVYYETGEEHQQALRRIVRVRYQDEAGHPFLPHEGWNLYRFTTTTYYEGPRGAETFVRTESTVKGPDGHEARMPDELPEDDPELMERAQRMYEVIRQRYSAFASVVHLAETGAVEAEYQEEEDME